MALQGLVRWLLPKEDHFYDYLETQGALCLDAASEALARAKAALARLSHAPGHPRSAH